MKLNFVIKYNKYILYGEIMNIYGHLKYRAAIKDIFETQQKLGVKRTLRGLAAEVGLQASFLTNVLKGRFDFNADQLYAIAKALEIPEAETKYLLLLLEHERSVNPQRKKDLKKEIDSLRDENAQTEKHISSVALSSDAMAEYYLDPFMPLVNLYLTISPYDENPLDLAKIIGISKDHLKKIFAVMERIGCIVPEGTRYKVLYQSHHLPKDNPLCNPHQSLIRIKSIDQMQRLDAREKYSFSATLSGSEETREKLQAAFMDFLRKAEALVQTAKSEKIYQMNFDLFPWQI